MTQHAELLSLLRQLSAYGHSDTSIGDDAADVLEALVAELNRSERRFAVAAARIEQLTAERDAAVADAERWRWLRKNKPFTLREFGFTESQIEHWSNAQNESKLDAAIDAAALAAERAAIKAESPRHNIVHSGRLD
jgi:hypothetical protein